MTGAVASGGPLAPSGQPPAWKFVAPKRLTSNYELAKTLAAAGVRVFPCIGGTGIGAKRPCPGVSWQGAPIGMGRIDQWWNTWRDAMVGITCAVQRIAFIDLDGDEGIAQWDTLAAKHAYAYPGVRTRTPGGGFHLPFKVPDSITIGNGIGALTPKAKGGKIDVRGPGSGYVIAPGSDNGEGGVYEPENGDVLAFLQAPLMPEWLVEVLTHKPEPEPAPAPAPAPAVPRNFRATDPGRTSTRREIRIEAWAEEAFEREIDAVRSQGEGGRNLQLNTSAFNLGQLVGAGHLDAGRVRAALLDAAAACGLLQDDGRKQCEDTIRSGLSKGTGRPREVPADILQDDDDEDEAFGRAAAAPALRAKDGTPADPDIGELLDARERKRPLFRTLPPAQDFPVAALGELRDAAEAIQLRTQAPLAICAQSVLAAVTLAVQAHRDVELPGGVGRKPLTGLFATVAESGERKTSVDKIALAAVYRFEEALRQVYQDELAAYQHDKEAWEAARAAVKRENKKNRGDIRDALAEVGSEPKPPPQPMVLVDDFSPEALELHLGNSRPYAGVFTSEGGILVGGHAFTAEKAMHTGALLNTLWDGSPIRRARVLTGNAFLPGRRCTAHIMMQQVVAEMLLSSEVLDGIGVTARLLIVKPESTIGTRLFRDATPECASVLSEYNERLRALLTRKPVTKADAPDVLDPPAMTLTLEAKAIWVQFYNEVEHSLAPGGAWRPIQAFGAKMAEHAGRLAAVLSVYANPDAMDVTAEAMEGGAALARHYASEMLRLRGGAAIPPDLRLADRLLKWLQEQPSPQFHMQAIYQRGPAGIRDAATAKRIVAILFDHGWIDRLPAGTVLDGSPRQAPWTMVQ